MPNTLTCAVTPTPSTEPVQWQHPNTLAWQDSNVLTGVSKSTTPYAVLCRLKNYPAITLTVTASGNVLNNVLAAPTGSQATATSTTALNVVVSSIANATAYRLLTSDTQNGTYTQLYQGTTASYAHTGLAAGVTKWYQWQYVGGGFYDDSAAGTAFSGTTSSVAAAPTITSFSPTTAAPGTTVTVTGTNLSGASNLRFNGVLATITANTATSITTTVPASASSGTISVDTSGGTAVSSTLFTVTAAGGQALPVQVICFGNSQTLGYLSTGGTSTIGSTSDGAWPDQFAALAGSDYVVRQKGVSGNDWTALQNRVSTDLGPLYQPASYSRQVVIVQEFTNAAWHSSQTGNNSNDGAKSVAAAIRALGFTEVWVFTAYPFLQTTDPTLTSNVNTLLDQANSVLLDSSGTNTYSAYGSFDKILNIRTSAAFKDSSAAGDTGVFVDGVHCTAYGNQTPAHLVLDAFGASTKVVNSTFTYPPANTAGGILGTAETLLRTDSRIGGSGNLNNNGSLKYTNNTGNVLSLNFTLGIKFVMGTQFTGGKAIIKIDGVQQTGPLANGEYSLVTGTVFEYHPNSGGHTFTISLAPDNTQYLILDDNTFTIWHA